MKIINIYKYKNEGVMAIIRVNKRSLNPKTRTRTKTNIKAGVNEIL